MSVVRMSDASSGAKFVSQNLHPTTLKTIVSSNASVNKPCSSFLHLLNSKKRSGLDVPSLAKSYLLLTQVCIQWHNISSRWHMAPHGRLAHAQLRNDLTESDIESGHWREPLNSGVGIAGSGSKCLKHPDWQQGHDPGPIQIVSQSGLILPTNKLAILSATALEAFQIFKDPIGNHHLGELTGWHAGEVECGMLQRHQIKHLVFLVCVLLCPGAPACTSSEQLALESAPSPSFPWRSLLAVSQLHHHPPLS